jgi:hypothetical protein
LLVGCGQRASHNQEHDSDQDEHGQKGKRPVQKAPPTVLGM